MSNNFLKVMLVAGLALFAVTLALPGQQIILGAVAGGLIAIPTVIAIRRGKS